MCGPICPSTPLADIADAHVPHPGQLSKFLGEGWQESGEKDKEAMYRKLKSDGALPLAGRKGTGHTQWEVNFNPSALQSVCLAHLGILHSCSWNSFFFGLASSFPCYQEGRCFSPHV